MSTLELLALLPAAYVSAWVLGLIFRLLIQAIEKLSRLSGF